MKIMIIDDEPDIRTYLTTVLEDIGHRVCSIAEDELPENVIRKEQPDLILLDIMMPGRSGISIYVALRRTPEFKSIPVVLISGMSAEKEFMKEFRRMIDDATIPLPDGFIEKPVQLAELGKMVDKLTPL